MRALVLGAGGQLGSDLVKVLSAATGLTHAELSVADLSALESAIERHRPEIVFNCAAFNAVDRAEAESQLAFSVNSDGAFNAAVACRRLGVRLVHYSTNFVFDGLLDRPYLESDPPRPLGVYAKSKLAGEQRVLAEHPSALVVRTAALFGDRGSAIKGGSFPERIVERAARGEHLRIVGDQRVNPTYTLDLARASIELAGQGTNGVVHVVAAGCCAWDELARATLAELGMPAEVETVTSDAFPATAPRPANGCLESARAVPLRPWRLALRDWAAKRRQRLASAPP
jgi:dTDP-4-dehydrorhamnose reductase